MPIRIEDPFQDPTEHLRSDVNPFLGKLKNGLEDPNSPLLYGEALRPWKGRWREAFPQIETKKPGDRLVLEIGSHKGEVLKNMAIEYPETNFIGIDITFKRVVSLAEKAQANKLQNIKSLLCNAKAIDLLFGEQELDGAIIFFPDPWARKKRQQKNRLINTDFLKKLASCIKDDGWLWIKTDHHPYFEQIQEALAQSGFAPAGPEISEITTGTFTSRFETHFTEQNLPTYEQISRKCRQEELGKKDSENVGLQAT